MSKISVKLNNDKSICSITDYPYSLNQRDQILVENNPDLTIENKWNWTVRKSDNILVHIDTGLTPDEENKASLTTLTKQGLSNTLCVNQLQAVTTTLTKQNLELTQDNIQLKDDRDQLQTALTQLTKEVIELKAKNTTTTN